MNLGRYVKERYAVATLAILFALCTAFVLAHPHSFENATVPDEKSYFGWGLLYDQGIYHVPLYDWYGVQAGFDFHVNSSGLHYLTLQERLVGSGGKNLEVTALFGDDTPASGVEVHVSSPMQKLDLTDSTNASGAALFTGIPKVLLSIGAHYSRPPSGPDLQVDLGVFDLYDASGAGEPYQASINITSFSLVSPGYVMEIRVRDSLGTSVPDANISLGVKASAQPPQLLGKTDGGGGFTIRSYDYGSQVIIAKKVARRGIIPIASVVPYGGTFVAVNHWAPGYSIILGLLASARLADSAGIIFMALAVVSTYLLARRFFGWKIALTSGVLMLTCAVALLLVWTSGMADYASMAFAVAGVWLLAEAIWVRRRWFVSVPLGVLGGMAMGAGVWVRYSTASVLVAVAFLLLALTLKDLRGLRGQSKRLLTAAKRFLLRAAPFTAGLLLLLIPLATYNSAYFGGPLGASHNYGDRISVDSSDGNTTANIVTGNVYSNFDPVGSIPTMTVRIHWLLLTVPVLILLPAALYMGWRRLAVIFLLAFVLSNLLLYLFVPWVASWWDPARSMEDTRYFLPALPPAAILGGLAITDALIVPKRRRALGLCVLLFLVVAGFAVAQAGIGYQMDRLRGPPVGIGAGGQPPKPPANYTLVTDNILIAVPGSYNGTLVEARNCTFDRWNNPASFLYHDASLASMLRVDMVGYSPPALGQGVLFNVKGVFHWNDGNHDGNAQVQELSIAVRGGTTDSITLA